MVGVHIAHALLSIFAVAACLPWIVSGVFFGKTYAVYKGVVFLKTQPIWFILGFISNLILSVGFGAFLIGDAIWFVHLYGTGLR